MDKGSNSILFSYELKTFRVKQLFFSKIITFSTVLAFEGDLFLRGNRPSNEQIPDQNMTKNLRYL